MPQERSLHDGINSPNRHHFTAGQRFPCLAAQPGMGLWPERVFGARIVGSSRARGGGIYPELSSDDQFSSFIDVSILDLGI